VHYYYPTTDDLFVALYRHTIEEDFKTMQKAITSADPLGALWAFQTQSARAVLGAEFLALANRRAVIREEIVQYVEHARNAQVQAILGLLKRGNGPAQEKFAVCVTTMLTCISRVLITEEAVGVGLGHAETRAFVDWAIKDFLVSKPSPKSPNGDALSNLILRFAAQTAMPKTEPLAT
jgi:AcrR family transcriptional regulator